MSGYHSIMLYHLQLLVCRAWLVTSLPAVSFLCLVHACCMLYALLSGSGGGCYFFAVQVLFQLSHLAARPFLSSLVLQLSNVPGRPSSSVWCCCLVLHTHAGAYCHLHWALCLLSACSVRPSAVPLLLHVLAALPPSCYAVCRFAMAVSLPFCQASKRIGVSGASRQSVPTMLVAVHSIMLCLCYSDSLSVACASCAWLLSCFFGSRFLGRGAFVCSHCRDLVQVPPCSCSRPHHGGVAWSFLSCSHCRHLPHCIVCTAVALCQLCCLLAQ
jgi:hypothetical protein